MFRRIGLCSSGVTQIKVLSKLELRTLIGLLTFVVLSSLAIGFGQAAERTALVITNTKYDHVKDGSLDVSVDEVVRALKNTGFEVTTLENSNYLTMRSSLRAFGSTSLGSEIALIYYAGYGVQVDQKNYLIPTDARLAEDLDVPFETVPLEMLLQSFKGAKKLRMVLMDTHHDNPFIPEMTIRLPVPSVHNGPAKVEPPVGTLITYASRHKGSEGGDSDVFKKALLQHLEEQGLEVQNLLGRVRDTVLASTGGKQEPVVFGSLSRERIFLKQQGSPAAASAKSALVLEPETDDSIELAYWDSIKDSMIVENFQMYLDRYPAGVFAQHANFKIGTLNSSQGSRSAASPSADNNQDDGTQPATRSLTQQPSTNENSQVKLSKLEVLKLELDQLAAKRAEEEGLSFGFELASFEPNAKAILELTSLSSKDLNKKIQKELNRVGCNAGFVDGVWGNGSKRAVRRFIRHNRNYFAESEQPSAGLYATLLQTERRICPLVCAKGFQLKGGKCSRVAQTPREAVAKQSANCGLCRDTTTDTDSFYRVCGADYFRKLGFGQCKKAN